LFFLLIFSECSFCQSQLQETFTDKRDAKVYKTVKIGNQTWIAENLNFSTKDSWCNQYETYGRLYTYDAALNACPTGWHLPSGEDWKTLTTYLGGSSTAGGKMKATILWKSPNTGATNMSGFNALPAGYRLDDNGSFLGLGEYACFWRFTPDANENAGSLDLKFDDCEADPSGNRRTCGLSVRCLKN
jgi:uncharacterized protein (TIGR02145 family)